jgi:hypothetical protein
MLEAVQQPRRSSLYGSFKTPHADEKSGAGWDGRTICTQVRFVCMHAPLAALLHLAVVRLQPGPFICIRSAGWVQRYASDAGVKGGSAQASGRACTIDPHGNTASFPIQSTIEWTIVRHTSREAPFDGPLAAPSPLTAPSPRARPCAARADGCPCGGGGCSR